MLFDVERAAEYTGFSKSQIYKWAEDGTLVGIKYGNKWRFTEEALRNPKRKESTHGAIPEQAQRKLVLSV